MTDMPYDNYIVYAVKQRSKLEQEAGAPSFHYFYFSFGAQTEIEARLVFKAAKIPAGYNLCMCKFVQARWAYLENNP